MEPLKDPESSQPGKINIYNSLLVLILFILLFAAFIKPAGSKEIHQRRDVFALPDTGKHTEPKVNIKVNRQFDEHGNITGFDSSYSYEFNFSDGKFSSEVDSMMRSFGMNFGSNPEFPFSFPSVPDVFFNDPFFQFPHDFPMDSLEQGRFRNPWGFAQDSGMNRFPHGFFIPSDSSLHKFFREPFDVPHDFFSMPDFPGEQDRQFMPGPGNDSIHFPNGFGQWNFPFDSIQKAKPKHSKKIWY